MLTLSAMTAFANAGVGIDSDPDASGDWNPHKVICLEDVTFKEYINDGDKVITTLPAGTILETNNRILRKGQDTGWSDTVVPYPDGGAGTAYFETNKTMKYDPKNPIEVEKSEDSKSLTIRLPKSGDEVYEYTVSDPAKIDMLTNEDTGDQFVISFRIVTEKDKEGLDEYPNGSINFVGKVDGHKAHEFTIDIPGGPAGFEIITREKPLDFSEIKDLIDRTEEKYLADGSTVKVNILKDGHVIDMNGYECVGIADDALQMIDGTVIHDQPTSK